MKDKVEADWNGEYYRATVIDTKNGKYLVSYDGYGSDAYQ